MDWVNVADRLPDEGTPVLMSEAAATWGDCDPFAGGGVLLLGIFKDGRFEVDRPPTYTANPVYWVAITIPGEPATAP